METLQLILEKGQEEWWGRVQYGEDLIVENAPTVQEVEQGLKKVILDLYEKADITFEHSYDLTAIFEEFKMLKISSIAEEAKINPGLLRQYAAGVKGASMAQVKKVEEAIHAIGKRLQGVHLYA
jgi:hypothetical protein